MITIRADFFDAVGVDVPEVALYGVEGVHLLEEVHVLADLGVVLGFRSTELEVDHDPFVAICHDAIWAALVYLTVFDGEDGTLIEECPTV
jgi:hypothetical protein